MSRLSDTLKQLDQALNDWENITETPDANANPLFTPPPRRPINPPGNAEAIQNARELLEKLRDQIHELEQ